MTKGTENDVGDHWILETATGCIWNLIRQGSGAEKFQKYLYRCPECGDCISEPVEFQADGHRITRQLQQMVEDCLAYGFNLTDTAQITSVGRNVVKSIDKARNEAKAWRSGRITRRRWDAHEWDGKKPGLFLHSEIKSRLYLSDASDVQEEA